MTQEETSGERLFNFGKIFTEALNRNLNEHPERPRGHNLILAYAECRKKIEITEKEKAILEELSRTYQLEKLLDEQLLVDYKSVLKDYL